jgi:hypothetical protein
MTALPTATNGAKQTAAHGITKSGASDYASLNTTPGARKFDPIRAAGRTTRGS